MIFLAGLAALAAFLLFGLATERHHRDREDLTRPCRDESAPPRAGRRTVAARSLVPHEASGLHRSSAGAENPTGMATFFTADTHFGDAHVLRQRAGAG